MKTFQEFILEASGGEEEDVDVAKKIAMLRAKANAAKHKGDMKTFLELQIQAGELQAGTRQKIKDATRDNPRTPSNPNSITGGGYPQVGTSQHSRIDPDTLKSQPNIEHPDDDTEARSNRVVAGRHSDTRKGAGMKATLKNRGTSMTGDTLGRTGRP
jgi:hypothetical protein